MKVREYVKKYKWFAYHDLCRADIVLYLLGILCCFLTMYYADITVTARFSLTFLDSLFDGKFLSFYDNALGTGIAPEGAVYDIGIYLIFAVWGLPVWILQKTVGVNPLSIGSLLWFKLLLILFVIASAVVLKNIADKLQLGPRRSEAVVLLYLCSLNLIFPVLVAAQYDIIPLFCLMCGVDCFLSEKKEKGFYIWFAVAMTMKPFALLPFIALVLMREKRILYIIRNWLCGISLMLACKFVYSFNSGYRESCGKFLTGMCPQLMEISIPVVNTQMSLFVAATVAVYIAAYGKSEYNNDVHDKRSSIIMITCIWAAFCLFTNLIPYWCIYFAPFLVLTVFLCGKKLNIALILDLAVNLTLTLICLMKYVWVYGGQKIFSYLILKPIYEKNFSDKECVTVAGILRRLGMEEFMPAFGAVLAVSVFFILYFAKTQYANLDEENAGRVEVWHFRIRIAMIYGWIFLCLAAFVLGIMGY